MRGVVLAAMVGLAVGWGGELGAQSSGSGREVTVLTLQEALERAARFNPQYRQALNRMELEGPQRRQALGAFLPDLSINYGTGQSFSRERTALDFFGNPIENPTFETVTYSSSGQGASVGLELFRGGQRFHLYGRARAQARVDRLSAQRDLNTILAEVQRHYLLAQRLTARLVVEEELLVARESDYEVTRRLFELATVGRSDLKGAELDLETQRATVTDYRGQVEKAMLALRRAIGDPALQVTEVEQQFPEPFDPASLNVAELVATAVQDNPAVGAAQAARSVSQSQLGSARASRWPTLSLNSGFQRDSFGLEQAALFDWNPEDVNGYLRLSVSIPLFRRFETSQQIASADVDLRNAGEELRRTELELEEQVRGAYVDLETAWANVRQRDIAAEVASERLRIVQEEYRLATKSIEELRTAIREEAAAQRDAVDQRFVFAEALRVLYEAAGIVAREAGLNTAREQD